MTGGASRTGCVPIDQWTEEKGKVPAKNPQNMKNIKSTVSCKSRVLILTQRHYGTEINLSKLYKQSNLVGWDRRMHVGWEGSLGDHSVWSQTVWWGVEAGEQIDRSVKKIWRQLHHDNTVQYCMNQATSTTPLCVCNDQQRASLYWSLSPTLTVFSWRFGTVFSQFTHSTHPFCKAVGSYASAIPPWENNTRDSEHVKVMQTPGQFVLKKNLLIYSENLKILNFWTCSWFDFQQEMYNMTTGSHQEFQVKTVLLTPSPSLAQGLPFWRYFPWFCLFFWPPSANLHNKGSVGTERATHKS